MDVRFLRGLATAYAAIAEKDDKTFYYVTDENKLYLGSVLLSNQVVEAEVDALEVRVKALEDADYQGKIDAINETLKSIATSDTVVAIDNRLKAVEADYLKSTDKTELEGKITAHENAVNTKFGDYSTTAEMNAAIDADVKVVTDYIAEHEAAWSEKTDITDLETRMTAVEGVADAAQTAQEVSDAIDEKITALDLANKYDAKGAAATAEQNAKDYADQALVDFENAWIKADENGTVDKLNEIAAWLNTEGAGAQKIIADVATNTANIATNAGDIDKVEAKLNGIAEGDGTVKAAIDAVDAKFAGYTKTTDLGDLATKDEADLNLGQYAKTADLGDLATKDTVAKTDLAADVQTSLGLADTALQEHQNIDHLATKQEVTDGLAGKVDKVEGKSLIADTEIARLANVTNYDDTQVKADIAKKADAETMTTELGKKVDTTTYTEYVNNHANDYTNTQIDTAVQGVQDEVDALEGVVATNAETCQTNFNTISNQLTWGSF